jgi:hypothetical protein
MIHPSKPWKFGLATILDFHNQARVIRRFTGNQGQPYPLSAFDYAGDPAGADMLAGSQMLVTEQRISGSNALLWSDPSMIL